MVALCLLSSFGPIAPPSPTHELVVIGTINSKGDIIGTSTEQDFMYMMVFI